MNTEYRLHTFRDMLNSCHNLYLWTFDPNMNLLSSNCPEETLITALNTTQESYNSIYAYAKEFDTPTLQSNAWGILWVTAPEKEHEELKRIHCLGPFFIDTATVSTVKKRLRELEFTKELYFQATTFLKELPTISLNRIFEYCIMLHHCITLEKISISDIHYQKNLNTDSSSSSHDIIKLHGTYAAEQEMLRYVREGNLDYREHMDKMGICGNIGILSKDPQRQYKNLLLVCITLFSRAAIEGGLSSEISFTLTDYYFQSVEAASSLEELAEISYTMQEDFITRVHRCRYDENISNPIRTAMEYIDLHLEDQITIEELAKMAGYSDYYFSKRFKREVGQTPKEYLRLHRLDRAKHLLRTTTLSIQDICCRLHFSSQSYFADAFHRTIGITPTEYREQEQIY